MAAHLQAEGPYTYHKDLIWKEYDLVGSIYPNTQINHSYGVAIRPNWTGIG